MAEAPKLQTTPRLRRTPPKEGNFATELQLFPSSGGVPQRGGVVCSSVADIPRRGGVVCRSRGEEMVS